MSIYSNYEKPPRFFSFFALLWLALSNPLSFSCQETFCQTVLYTYACMPRDEVKMREESKKGC